RSRSPQPWSPVDGATCGGPTTSWRAPLRRTRRPAAVRPHDRHLDAHLTRRLVGRDRDALLVDERERRLARRGAHPPQVAVAVLRVGILPRERDGAVRRA